MKRLLKFLLVIGLVLFTTFAIGSSVFADDGQPTQEETTLPEKPPEPSIVVDESYAEDYQAATPPDETKAVVEDAADDRDTKVNDELIEAYLDKDIQESQPEDIQEAKEDAIEDVLDSEVIDVKIAVTEGDETQKEILDRNGDVVRVEYEYTGESIIPQVNFVKTTDDDTPADPVYLFDKKGSYNDVKLDDLQESDGIYKASHKKSYDIFDFTYLDSDGNVIDKKDIKDVGDYQVVVTLNLEEIKRINDDYNKDKTYVIKKGYVLDTSNDTAIPDGIIFEETDYYWWWGWHEDVNLTNQKVLNFRIVPAVLDELVEQGYDFTGATVSVVDEDGYVEFTTKAGGTVKVDSKDVEITYVDKDESRYTSDPRNVGEYQAVVVINNLKSLRNYNFGRTLFNLPIIYKTVDFKIEPIYINDDIIITKKYDYQGIDITDQVADTIGFKDLYGREVILVEGEDYFVKYNGTDTVRDAGDYVVAVTLEGPNVKGFKNLLIKDPFWTVKNKINVKQAQLVIDWGEQVTRQEYTGEELGFVLKNVEVKGLVGEDTIEESKLSTKATNGKDVILPGEYTLKLYFGEAEDSILKNYTIKNRTKDLTVIKEVKVVWDETETTYDGTVQKPTAKLDGFVNNKNEIYSISLDVDTYNSEYPLIKEDARHAGTYVAKAEISKILLPDYYYLAKTEKISETITKYVAKEDFVINKAVAYIVWDNTVSKLEDGNKMPYVASIDGLADYDKYYPYSHLNRVNPKNIPVDLVEDADLAEAGKYTAKVNFKKLHDTWHDLGYDVDAFINDYDWKDLRTHFYIVDDDSEHTGEVETGVVNYSEILKDENISVNPPKVDEAIEIIKSIDPNNDLGWIDEYGNIDEDLILHVDAIITDVENDDPSMVKFDIQLVAYTTNINDPSQKSEEKTITDAGYYVTIEITLNEDQIAALGYDPEGEKDTLYVRRIHEEEESTRKDILNPYSVIKNEDGSITFKFNSNLFSVYEIFAAPHPQHYHSSSDGYQFVNTGVTETVQTVDYTAYISLVAGMAVVAIALRKRLAD